MQALATVGAINDQMQEQKANSDVVSLATEENVGIRGNDARVRLMHKLMRTNRSSVILLKNMATAEQVDTDEYLEEDIREECNKFGQVLDVSLPCKKSFLGYPC